MNIGKKIALLRKNKGITQAQLADYLAVTPQTVSRWEANNGVPDIYLLPQLATFFGVSMETLFGISGVEKVEKLVMKYSVLRDEKSFEDAMLAIDNELDNAKARKSDEDEQKLIAQKMHMYLQRSRAMLNEADKYADELIEKAYEESNPWYLPARLQKVQFNVLNGKGVETLKTAKADLELDPTYNTLFIYMIALEETMQYQKILEQYTTNEFLQRLLSQKDDQAAELWSTLFRAAYQERNLDFYENHFPDFETFANMGNLIEARIGLTRLYAEQHMDAQKEACKKKLLGEISFFQNNEMMMQLYIDMIKQI